MVLLIKINSDLSKDWMEDTIKLPYRGSKVLNIFYFLGYIIIDKT
jgi:hypothetical protein